jgi:hypothetical protein
LLRILAHELAHELYENLTKEELSSYKATMNWIEIKNTKGTDVTIDRGSGFVAEDGRIGPEEDFANNVEFYLFENSRLKSVTPNAYEWLKNRFGDNFKIGSACVF